MEQGSPGFLLLLNFLGNFYFASWNSTVALGFFFVVAVLFWLPDVILCLQPFSFACGSFIIKGDAQGRSKEGNTDIPKRVVGTSHRNITSQQIIPHHTLAHLWWCATVPNVLGWLAMGLSLLQSLGWAFRFPFSIFAKPKFKLKFYFACVKKKASVCASIVLNQYSSACLKVGFLFFFFLNKCLSFPVNRTSSHFRYL